jgi:hypothetical protein
MDNEVIAEEILSFDIPDKVLERVRTLNREPSPWRIARAARTGTIAGGRCSSIAYIALETRDLGF